MKCTAFAKSVILTASSLVWLLAPSATHAADSVSVISTTVHPQATTRPALAYRLLPASTEATPGDAANIYLTAATLNIREDDQFKEVTDDDAKRFGLPSADGRDWASLLLDAPLEMLRSGGEHPPEGQSAKTADAFIASRQTVIRYLDIAARRETCRWDLPIRELGFATLLPHLSQFRSACRAVNVKARYQMARGDFAGAVRSIQANFALVRALNQQSVLIQSLVGASIGGETLKVLREMATQPGCPNLFWALAELPRPMLDFHESLEMERRMLNLTIPQLTRARQGQFTETDWQDVSRQITELTAMASPQPGGVGTDLGRAAASVFLLAEGRRWLAARGMTREQLDAMPPAAILGKYTVDSYDEIYDEMIKWSSLPVWQGRAGQLRFEKAFSAQRKANLMANPICVMVPAVSKATFSVRRLDRDLAAAQTIEALRAFAASHDGALPASLDQISETPAPVDPMTGQYFTYRVEGNTATLESHVAEESPKDALVMKITLMK